MRVSGAFFRYEDVLQQIALKTQRKRSSGIHNGPTCFFYIDIEDLLAVDAFDVGSGTMHGHEPISLVSSKAQKVYSHIAYQTVATPCLCEVRT